MKSLVVTFVLLVLLVSGALARRPLIYLAPMTASSGGGGSPPITGGDLFVATTGNDTTGNGSSGNPWRTIQKAATTATAGQVVNIAAGTYQERVTFPNAGTAGN